jgi:hypothetical protein
MQQKGVEQVTVLPPGHPWGHTRRPAVTISFNLKPCLLHPLPLGLTPITWALEAYRIL